MQLEFRKGVLGIHKDLKTIHLKVTQTLQQQVQLIAFVKDSNIFCYSSMLKEPLHYTCPLNSHQNWNPSVAFNTHYSMLDLSSY